MATITKPLFTKRVGHVGFRSTLTRDAKKGLFVVSGKHNGLEVVGTGPTERQAALDFHKQLDEAVESGKTKTRG